MVSQFNAGKVGGSDLTPSPIKNPEKMWSSEKCIEMDEEEKPEGFTVNVKKLPGEGKLVGAKRPGS